MCNSGDRKVTKSSHHGTLALLHARKSSKTANPRVSPMVHNKVHKIYDHSRGITVPHIGHKLTGHIMMEHNRLNQTEDFLDRHLSKGMIQRGSWGELEEFGTVALQGGGR